MVGVELSTYGECEELILPDLLAQRSSQIFHLFLFVLLALSQIIDGGLVLLLLIFINDVADLRFLLFVFSLEPRLAVFQR